MHVDRLYLNDFKNLRDFEVDFDVTSSRQVVIGRNGVGKSNLLEALIWIFRELDLEEDASFAYKIEYHCNGRYIKIESSERERKNQDEKIRFIRSYWISQPTKSLDETSDREYKPIKQSEFYRRNRSIGGSVSPDRLLPQYVFGYYSGVSGRFNRAFERHEEKYYREQIDGDEAPLRPLFLAKPHHSQFALLSFFASNDELAKKFLRDEFHIEGLQSVLFALHNPYWKKPAPRTGIDDKRFWRAGGKVAAFLDSLFCYALAPMTGSMRRRVSLGQEKSFEMRYCYIPDEETLRSLADSLEPKEFFARLESTIFSDLVSSDGKDVRIHVRLNGQPEPVTFQELSEGEQQLLTIIGLMRFTAQEESLFLLDEPDTHLNPAWCLDFFKNLRDYDVEPKDSQMIMTTHSPLTFAGLDENEVVIMERQDNGAVTSQHPLSPPKGMGFQAILTSEFFQLRSALDRETLAKIDTKRELALKENKTEDDLAQLSKLDEELGRLDFSKAARDPLYLEFIRAMTIAQRKHPEIANPKPDTSDWHSRKKLADDIAARLLQSQEAHEVR